MNLNPYSILSNLIPGFLVYFVGLNLLGIDPKYYDPVIAIVIAYIVGYFVNAISAWSEKILYWTWGGKPSDQLFQDKSCGRIQFLENKKLKPLLRKQIAESKSIKINELFAVALRIANCSSRVDEMSAQYVFARAIFVAVLVSLGLLSVNYHQNIAFWAVSVPILVASWYRAKERGFYYAKEVLTQSLNKLTRND